MLFCEVVALAEAGTGDALVYADGHYHSIPVGVVSPAQDAA